MESFFSSFKTERTTRRIYRTRDDAKADVFDYIERFYNPKRQHSTIGYLSPMQFERQAGLAYPAQARNGPGKFFRMSRQPGAAHTAFLRSGSNRARRLNVVNEANAREAQSAAYVVCSAGKA
jgi:hypothetical protein